MFIKLNLTYYTNDIYQPVFYVTAKFITLLQRQISFVNTLANVKTIIYYFYDSYLITYYSKKLLLLLKLSFTLPLT